MYGSEAQVLNSAQQAAVDYIDGPLLLVAGAGTGKTTVITEKIAHLIVSGQAQPEEILALTFTDKAAEEMAARVDRRLPLGYTELAISTFHSFCQSLLERKGLDIGAPNRFKLLTETEAWLLVHEHLYDFNLDYYRPLGNPTRHIHELLKHFSKCKDELVTPADYLRYAEETAHDKGDDNGDEKSRLTEVANGYHVYNQLLLKVGALDFGDLIFYGVKLLQERPRVQTALQNRYKFILVDEFQDVNWAQYQLVRLLAGEQNQLTVVGDDDQSIYAFRGASVSNILRFKEDYPQAKEIVLSENFRSTQAILDAAYIGIQNNNPDRLEVKLGLNKKLKSARAAGETKAGENEKTEETNVKHLSAATLDEEVGLVVREIMALKASDASAAWDDFAILVRANAHAEPFIQALERAKIPYEFLSAAGLYRQPVVLDIFNFFKIIDQRHESAAIFRLLTLPSLSLSANDLQKFTAAARKKSVSYYEGLKLASEWALSKAGMDGCQKLLALIDDGVKAARAEKPSAVMYQFLEDSGYLEYLTHQETLEPGRATRQINYLKQWFEFVTRYEISAADPCVANFVVYVNSILESGDEGKLYQPSDTPDSVNILTVHGAKGLEFRYVFIVNLVEDRFPTRHRGEAVEMPLALVHERLPEGDYHIQEERRLFYVAITRAKDRLYLASADSYGGTRPKKLSRFLAELGYGRAEVRGKAATDVKAPALVSAFTRKVLPEAVSEKADYEMPAAFSFSQIKAYETCPYQYKLAHILRIPTRGNASFSFGQTMHATLQRFYEKVRELNASNQATLFWPPATSVAEASTVTQPGKAKAPSLDELLALYKECWIGDWYRNRHQREEYYELGRDILKRFYAAEEGCWTVPISLEGYFKIKVGDYLVNGRMDRVDQLSDGSLEIVDYKTGQSKEKLTVGDKDQLLIYQIAAETLPQYAHIGRPSKLTFFYLHDLLRTSFIGDSQDLARIKDKLVTTIDKIKTGNFAATPSAAVCGHCDFRDICEFRIL